MFVKLFTKFLNFFILVVQMVKVNKNRINVLNDTEPDIKSGEYVLYWVLMYRRTRYNHALQRAIEWANELEKPLLVFEPLQLKYEWASD